MGLFKERLRQLLKSIGLIVFTGWLAFQPTNGYAIIQPQLTAKADKIKKIQRLIKSQNRYLTDDIATEIAVAHLNASNRYNIDVSLGLAVSFKESTFYPNIKSKDGVSVGLMMVNQRVWTRPLHLDTSKLTNIEYNLDVGYQILSKYIEMYGVEQGIKRYRGSTKSRTNIRYLNKIIQLKIKFEKWLVFDPEPAVG